MAFARPHGDENMTRENRANGKAAQQAAGAAGAQGTSQVSCSRTSSAV